MKGRFARHARVLALVALFGVLGCDYDAGHDYAVAVPWLINGLAPTSKLCADYGVKSVRLTVSTASSDRTTTMPCDQAITLADGTDYGGFVTNVAFDFDLIYGVTVEMIDAQGKRVDDVFYKDTFQVFYGDELPWVLRPLELLSPTGDLASLSGSWDVGSGEVAQGCTDERIDTIVVWVTSRTDADFMDAIEIANAPCTEGAFVTDAPVLSEGDYLFKYVALDNRGAIVEQGDAYEALVDKAGELALPRQRFGRP